jgi:hypothetical protein
MRHVFGIVQYPAVAQDVDNFALLHTLHRDLIFSVNGFKVIRSRPASPSNLLLLHVCATGTSRRHK